MDVTEQKKGMSMRTKLLFGLAAAAVIAAVVLGAFFYGISRGNKTAEPVITADLLGQSLRSAQELVSVSYYYTNMAKYENQKDFYGWKVPFTGKSFIVSYDGIIKAGVDLSKAAVDVDETNKSVIITLPESQIISHEISEDSLEVFDESDNVFNRISIEDYNEFTVDQKAALEERAVENGLLVKAQEDAEEAVISLLKLLPGMEEYTLMLRG